MGEPIRIASASELAPGEFKAVSAGEHDLVLYNVDGTFHVTSPLCIHQGGPLVDGLFDGRTVTCPWHAWQFDVPTGEALYEPGRKLDCFAVRVDGDDVFVEI